MSKILPAFFDLLCNPITREPLHLVDGRLMDSAGNSFRVVDGIPDLRAGRFPLRHRLWEWVYNLSAFGYDFGVRYTWRFGFGGSPIRRNSYLHLLDASSGDIVLETAVGTGDNLSEMPPEVHCVGMDRSRGMLNRCMKKLQRTGRSFGLFQADMAALPFVNDGFDMVFHVGGLQFLSNPRRGVAEMLRVARPGSTLTVVDEASSLKATLRRAGAPDAKDLAGPDARLVRFERISGGELYCMQFFKDKTIPTGNSNPV